MIARVLLELQPTFSWDSANSTYGARHGIVTQLWYVAMQPGAWHQMLEGELRFASKNPWVFFFETGSNILITRGVTIFR